MTEVFLDTGVLLGRVLGTLTGSEGIFNDNTLERYTNEYCLKEAYRVLRDAYGYSDVQIGYALEYIRSKCLILPTPSKEEFRKIDITDRSDRPVVFSAYKYGLVLYTTDERTYRDSKRYVTAKKIGKSRKKR
ncbi:MAG: hypothetical protein L0213_04595 [Candidatus Dadabacteria bacterium]|nr:hypothetical protein [Candidatus Dadabacteria bacterium]